jgi:hypothetical protein
MGQLCALNHPDIVSQLPRRADGKPIPADTLREWIATGVRTATGERVRLKAVRVGGRYFLDPDSLREFVAATTGEIPSSAV